MIPPISRHPPAARPVLFDPSSNEMRTHILALSILTMASLLLLFPWEIALPFSACVLVAGLLCSLPQNPPLPIRHRHVPHPTVVQTTCPPPLRSVRPPTHFVQEHCPAPSRTAEPTYFVQEHCPAPSRRAPVGTGAPTRFVQEHPAAPTGRAPVGTGAPTRFVQEHPAAPSGRAPVGR